LLVPAALKAGNLCRLRGLRIPALHPMHTHTGKKRSP
jgi:hypothetical protein